jgi:hypothetical protein
MPVATKQKKKASFYNAKDYKNGKARVKEIQWT